MSSSTGRSLEVRERRVAGAEVVERRAGRRGRAAREDVRARARVGHDGVLGDLERRAGRRDAGARSSRATVVREVEVEQVRGGDVDRDREVEPGRRATPRRWARRRRATRSVSGRIRPVCSASGRKAAGVSRPRVGCCQRTSASTPLSAAGARCRPWAGSGGRAAARDRRRAARRGARGGRGCASSRSGAVDARPPLRSRLGLVHRDVGVLEQLDRGLRVRREERRCRCSRRPATGMPSSTNGSSRLARRRSAARRAPPRRRSSASTTANSSPPSRASRSPARAPWPARRGAERCEQQVAGVVAERVVELLEAVEVDEQEAGRRGPSAIAASRRRASARRLGRPVRSSVSAWRRVSAELADLAEGDRRPGAPTSDDRGGGEDDRRSGARRRAPRPRGPPTATSVETDGIAERAPLAAAGAARRRAAARRRGPSRGRRRARRRRATCPGRRCRARPGRGRCASASAVAEHAEAEQQPRAARAPAREAEDADHGRDQQQVGDRVGEVDRDDERLARRRGRSGRRRRSRR